MRDELKHDFQGSEGFSTPIDRDKGKEPMLNLVPFEQIGILQEQLALAHKRIEELEKQKPPPAAFVKLNACTLNDAPLTVLPLTAT
jgi:hypothetical protein